MKYIILGLLISSNVYAQKNNLTIEFERGTNSMMNSTEQEVENFSTISIGLEHDFRDSVYAIVGVSSGDGSFDRILRKGKNIIMSSTPSEYYAFKIGIGWRF